MSKRFWRIKNYQDRKLVEDVNRFESFFWVLGVYYIVGLFLLTSGFAIKPAFAIGKQLPFLCWMQEGNPSPLYEIIYAIQVYILWIITPAVGGFDVFYTAINTGIAVQFKILRHELEHLVEKDDKHTAVKVKKCIQHHQLLLEYVINVPIYLVIK